MVWPIIRVRKHTALPPHAVGLAGFYDAIRDLFTGTPLAVEREYQPGRFSFNLGLGRENG